MSRKKTHVNPGDEVQVIAGNHKGKQGTVLEVHAEKEQVVVEGVRVMKKIGPPLRGQSRWWNRR